MSSAVIRDCKEELLELHARHFANEPTNGRLERTNGYRAQLSDEEVIELARNARNRAKFEALHDGDISGYGSHSEADQAYVSLLAFYTQDEEQLDSLLKRSALCREKWVSRPDYRRRTIETALSNLPRPTHRTTAPGWWLAKVVKKALRPRPRPYIRMRDGDASRRW